MGMTSGMIPIFKTGVLGCSDDQPTESWAKSKDFDLICALFRGLNVMQSNACKNAQSRVRV